MMDHFDSRPRPPSARRASNNIDEELSRKLGEIARYACNDCGANVLMIGEFYMVKPQIWEDQLGLGWGANLCIGCLETRLGRTVSLLDMGSFPSYEWMQPMSIRLQHRFWGHGVTKRPPYRWLKWLVKNTSGFTRKTAKAIGEYGERERAAS